MKQRFYLFKRGGVFYLQDGTTGRQESLKIVTGTRPKRLLTPQ